MTYSPKKQTKRRLTGYCGWKIWNTNSGKTCDQVAVELAAASSSNNNNDNGAILSVAEAKSQILTQGCVCEEGEQSFDNDVITPVAFCGKCRYRDAPFSCDDRVEFVMSTYPDDNPTIARAQMNILRRGDCIDRNWAPYAQRMEFNSGGGGLSGGAIAGIVIAALALCAASMAACCIMRDLKKVKLEEEEGGNVQMQEGAKSTTTNNAKPPQLNVIQEGNEDEEEESVMVAVSASGAPQSNASDVMSDDQTEIITNRGNKGNEE